MIKSGRMKYLTIQSSLSGLKHFSSGTLVCLLLSLLLVSGCSNGGGNDKPDEEKRTLEDPLNQESEEEVTEEVTEEQSEETVETEIGAPVNEVDAALRTVSVNSEDLSGLWVAHFAEKLPMTIVGESGNTFDTSATSKGFVVLHIEDHGDAISLAQCSGSADTENAVYLNKNAAASKQLSDETLAELGQLLWIQPNENLIVSPDLSLTIHTNTRMEIGPLPVNYPPLQNTNDEEPPEYFDATILLQKVRSAGMGPIGTYESSSHGTLKEVNCFSFETTSWDWSFEGEHSTSKSEIWYVMSPSDVLETQREPVAAYTNVMIDDSRSEIDIPQKFYFLVSLEEIEPLKELMEGVLTKDGEPIEWSPSQILAGLAGTAGDFEMGDLSALIGEVPDFMKMTAIFAWIGSLFSQPETYDALQTSNPGLSYELRYTHKVNEGDERIIRIQLTDEQD